jgi:hypothetical protein
LLQVLSLSDRYERKTQLLPGAIAASPLALTLATTAAFVLPWYGTVGATVGAELLLAFLLGYLARARGRAAEAVMWREWGGPPTTRWLRPSDTTCSEQQKVRWRGVLQRLTGLEIPASVASDRTEEDIDRVTNDAIRQVRNRLRNQPAAAMVQIHNEDYGLARNLLGLRWHWLGVGVVSVLICVALFATGEKPFVGLAVSLISLVMALLIGQQLPDQVRRCADRYAESLFTAAVQFDEGNGNPPGAPTATGTASAEK